MTVQKKYCPKVNRRVRCRYLPEWGLAMAYSPMLHENVQLNQVAYLILSLCDGTHDIQYMKDLLNKHFEGPFINKKVISNDINNILVRFQQTGLIE